FGGREDLSMQVHGALLALHTSRPVKMVYSREESFVGHVHRHPAKIWMEHRATRAGRLVNVRARILLDGGAYASSSAAVTSNAACFAVGPYSVENALIECICVYSNNPPCGAMRGFGAVQSCFAHEAQMDCAAAEVGQGVTNVILQVARTELGTENVALAPGSTAGVESSGSASASRLTWMAAGAVRLACRDALAEYQSGRQAVDVQRTYHHP